MIFLPRRLGPRTGSAFQVRRFIGHLLRKSRNCLSWCCSHKPPLQENRKTGTAHVAHPTSQAPPQCPSRLRQAEFTHMCMPCAAAKPSRLRVMTVVTHSFPEARHASRSAVLSCQCRPMVSSNCRSHKMGCPALALSCLALSEYWCICVIRHSSFRHCRRRYPKLDARQAWPAQEWYLCKICMDKGLIPHSCMRRLAYLMACCHLPALSSAPVKRWPAIQAMCRNCMLSSLRKHPCVIGKTSQPHSAAAATVTCQCRNLARKETCRPKRAPLWLR